MSETIRPTATDGVPGEWDRHETVHADLRKGDLCRVAAGGATVDGGAVIAKWPFAQADFDPTRHDEIPTKRREWVGLTDECDERTTVTIDGAGMRTTLATADGSRYAIVDWSKTDDPAYLYLLVIDSDQPDQRRWDTVGEVTHVERYGPEPEYRMTGFQWSRSRDRHRRVLSLAADGELETYSFATIPDRESVLDLADRLGADEPRRLTREDLNTLDAAYTTAHEYVDRTGEPFLTADPSEDLDTLDRDFAPSRYIALFPDGRGGWTERHIPGHGPPSEDVPPWVVEQDADPEFVPLGRDTDG